MNVLERDTKEGRMKTAGVKRDRGLRRKKVEGEGRKTRRQKRGMKGKLAQLSLRKSTNSLLFSLGVKRKIPPCRCNITARVIYLIMAVIITQLFIADREIIHVVNRPCWWRRR